MTLSRTLTVSMLVLTIALGAVAVAPTASASCHKGYPACICVTGLICTPGGHSHDDADGLPIEGLAETHTNAEPMSPAGASVAPVSGSMGSVAALSLIAVALAGIVVRMKR